MYQIKEVTIQYKTCLNLYVLIKYHLICFWHFTLITYYTIEYTYKHTKNNTVSNDAWYF